MSFFGFFKKNKITDQLKNTSNKISSSISEIFTHKKIDETFLEELEEILIISDIGVANSSKIIKELKRQKFNKQAEEAEIKEFLAMQIEEILKNSQENLFEKLKKSDKKPKVILFNGVNGAGKTTTLGKIAHNLQSQNQKTLIAACDTFRAAAALQLETWANRAGCEIVKAQNDKQDPASVAYTALKKAKEENFDYLLIDTAGRLQNKQHLMDELKKINKVLLKIDEDLFLENLLILDGTAGQNSKNQAKIFDEIINIDGIIITKLDGSSKGGIAVFLADEFKKPIYGIGIGEKIEDLQEFDAKNYAKNLVGV